jgi:hypothetical protein
MNEEICNRLEGRVLKGKIKDNNKYNFSQSSQFILYQVLGGIMNRVHVNMIIHNDGK